jgi:hypothetical protein
VAVTGNVAGPGGGIAKATSSSKSWFASLFEASEAFAQQVTGWSAVSNATVRVFRIDNTGTPVGTMVITPVTTAADGSFSLMFPTGTVLDSTLVAQVENDPAINGPVPVGTANTYSTLLVQATIVLNPAVEAATKAIVDDPAPLTNFSNSEVIQILSGISNLVSQNQPAPPVTTSAIATNFSAAITSAVNATSGISASAPVILTATLANGMAGTTYTTILVAVGGTQPYTWSVVPNSNSLLPLSLSPAGAISGIPAAATTLIFTVQVKDSNNLTAQQGLSITIDSVSPDITGVWTMTFNEFAGSYTLTPTLSQSGTSVSGTQQGESIDITGSINGNNISLAIPLTDPNCGNAQRMLTLTGTVSGNTMSGSYSRAAGGSCSAFLGGTWSGTR